VYDIDTHELNLRPFRDLKFLNEISLKECVFLPFLSNKCIIHFLKGKQTLPYQRGGDFIDGHCISFSILFCLIMFHEQQI
jgi:hypothetical protein